MLPIMAPLAQFLATEGIEGIRLQTYDDKTGDRLDEGETPVGKASIAVGLIKYSDGTPVKPGDELTLQEAWDETYHYLNKVLTPALSRLITVNLPDHKLMAFASWLYNFGETKAKNYSLPKLINSDAGDRAIVEKWLEYVNAGGKPQLGLYRRRLAEALMWLDYDWRPALNADWDTSIDDLIIAEGGEALLEDDLFEPEPVASIQDPTPETPVTPDDAQYMGYVAAVGNGEKVMPYADFMAHRTVVSARDAIKAPNVVTTNEPKAMEDSKTGRGMAKQVSGKDDVRIASIMTGSSVAAGTAAGLSKDVAAAMENTQTIVGGITAMQLVWVGLFIGFPFLIYGLWKMLSGRWIKKEGREEATQVKV